MNGLVRTFNFALKNILSSEFCFINSSCHRRFAFFGDQNACVYFTKSKLNSEFNKKVRLKYLNIKYVTFYTYEIFKKPSSKSLHFPLKFSTNDSTKCAAEKNKLQNGANNGNENKEKDTKRDEDFSMFNKLIQNRVLTIPNILTTVRIILTPLLGYLVLQQSYNFALSVFLFAGFTDLLDGLIARTFPNQTSDLGSFLDPLADKFLVSTLFLSLTYINLIPVYLMLLVITRDILLTCSGVYIRYITLDPKPKSIKEFFDPSNRSVKLQPTFISKFNTAVQLSLVAATLASPVFDFVNHQYIQALWYLTAGTTIASGIGYIFAKNTFKLVDKTYKNK